MNELDVEMLFRTMIIYTGVTEFWCQNQQQRLAFTGDMHSFCIAASNSNLLWRKKIDVSRRACLLLELGKERLGSNLGLLVLHSSAKWHIAWLKSLPFDALGRKKQTHQAVSISAVRKDGRNAHLIANKNVFYDLEANFSLSIRARRVQNESICQTKIR